MIFSRLQELKLLQMPLESKQFMWVSSEKIFRFALGIVLTSALARSLGPANFGSFIVFLTILAIVPAASSFGTHGQLVSAYVKGAISNRIEAFFVICFFFLAALASLLLFDVYFDELSGLITSDWMMVICLCFAASRAVEVVRARAEAEGALSALSRREAILNSILALTKIGVLIHGHLNTLVLLYALEGLFLFAATRWNIFRKVLPRINFSEERKTVVTIVRSSQQVLLSNLLVIFVLSYDKIMIFHYATDDQDFYRAATAIITAFLFLPVALGGAFASSLIKLYLDQKTDEYRKMLSKAYSIGLLLSISVSFILSVFSSIIISLTLGPGYEATAKYLMVSCWILPIISIVSIRNRFLIIENKQNAVLKSSLMLFATSLAVLFHNMVNEKINLNILMLVIWGIGGILFPLMISEIRNHHAFLFGRK